MFDFANLYRNDILCVDGGFISQIMESKGYFSIRKDNSNVYEFKGELGKQQIIGLFKSTLP